MDGGRIGLTSFIKLSQCQAMDGQRAQACQLATVPPTSLRRDTSSRRPNRIMPCILYHAGTSFEQLAQPATAVEAACRHLMSRDHAVRPLNKT